MRVRAGIRRGSSTLSLLRGKWMVLGACIARLPLNARAVGISSCSAEFTCPLVIKVSRGVRPMADQLLTAAMVHVFALAGFAAGIATLWAISRACRAARKGLRWCWRRCAHG